MIADDLSSGKQAPGETTDTPETPYTAETKRRGRPRKTDAGGTGAGSTKSSSSTSSVELHIPAEVLAHAHTPADVPALAPGTPPILPPEPTSPLATHTSDNRPSVYVEGGMPVYRASGIMGCPRALWLARQGYEPTPPPEGLRKAFDAGNVMERVVVRKLREEGFYVEEAQEAIEVKVAGCVVRGHLDVSVLSAKTRPNLDRGMQPFEKFKESHPGLAGWDGGACIAEIKSMNADEYERWGREGFSGWPKYAAQAAIYMRAKSMPLVYVVAKREKDENGFEGWRIADWRLEFYKEPPMPFGTIAARVLQIEAAVKEGNQPTCPGHDLKRWCGYQIHHDDSNSAPDAMMVTASNPVAAVIEDRYKLGLEKSRLESEAKEIEKRIRVLDVQIVEALGDESKMVSGVYTVSKVTVSRFDQTRFLNAHPEVKEDERWRASSSYLRVNGPQDKSKKRTGEGQGEREGGN